MTTPTAPPPPSPGAVAGSGPAIGSPTATATRQQSAASSSLNTVRFLHRWNIILPILIVATGLIGVAGSFVVQSAARSTTESTGPSLIEVQDLFASVAEANTAATAAHLAVDATGSEDRASRNLYVDALRRSHEHLAEVAADIGQAPVAQAELQDIGAALAAYNGEVEAARLAKLQNLPSADSRLTDALNILNSEIEPSVAAINAYGQSQYNSEAEEGLLLIIAAVAIGVISLILMIWMQVKLAYRTRRILNPLLVLSTLALAALVGLLIYGNTFRSLTLADADTGGYDAIGSSAEMQEAAFSLQSQLALLLLDSSGDATSRAAEMEELIVRGESKIETIVRQADSNRETAAATTLSVRWDRYINAVSTIQDLSARGDKATAVRLFQSSGIAAFNGLNTSIESVLLDNQLQFSEGIDSASRAVDFNPWICLVLTVIAGLLAIVAIQRRLGDYR